MSSNSSSGGSGGGGRGKGNFPINITVKDTELKLINCSIKSVIYRFCNCRKICSGQSKMINQFGQGLANIGKGTQQMNQKLDTLKNRNMGLYYNILNK